jgi:Lipin/Ned1/Smp2 multi-domain protein middle domain
LTEEQKNRIFDLNKITYEAFLKDPAKIATETKLVFRFGGVIYQKEVGFAILIAKSIYGTDLR